MRHSELTDRTKAFALAIIDLVERLPRTRTGEVLGRQLIRAGTSVAANYRSACRGRSRKDFIAKLGIVEEEADEAQFWLELVGERRLVDPGEIARLRKEAGQLVAIIVTSIRTARGAPRLIPHSAFRIPHSSVGAPRVY